LQDLIDKFPQKLDSASIKTGFPLKLVDKSDPTATLVTLGIKNGEQLVVEIFKGKKKIALLC
jgi:hypothetical protein